jgi:hypothetical protein
MRRNALRLDLLARVLACALALISLHGLAATTRVHAEPWLCPVCQVEIIDRADSTAALDCPRCKLALPSEDLRWTIGYLAVRTRPAEVVWDPDPECGIFRKDGLLAFREKLQGPTLWVPWSAVDYYIPRQRILRLTSGRELGTPYSKGPDCESPPLFVVSLADSTGDFTGNHAIRTTAREEDMSALFLVARNSVARDSARARFIREVEGGKHPRLPRTEPQAMRLAAPTVPAEHAGVAAVVVLQARISDRGGIVKVNRIKGSGIPEIDRAALMALYRSSLLTGGEMGVGVPSSMDVTYTFSDGQATVTAAPSRPCMWGEWLSAPKQ